MQQEMTNLPEIKLVGITTRTSNAEIFNADPAQHPILLTVQKYFQNGLPGQIDGRITPGTTYCVYTEYESDYNGPYTYFIGEAVDSLEGIKEGLVALTIAAQRYAKFTDGPAAMPGVCVNMWQQIWHKTPADLGGQRAYIADFEVYDARAMDQASVILDIYIGVN